VPLNVIKTGIPDCVILQPVVFHDERGFFFESFNKRGMVQLGIDYEFVQDNQSHSKRNVLRGLHYQIKQIQGKLVRAISGEIFDVAVDLRKSSPTFGKWIGARLTSADRSMIWIPPGFAHGFVVLSEHADVAYKATDFYAPEHERTILSSDRELNIQWPVQEPILSAKDLRGTCFRSAEVFE